MKSIALTLLVFCACAHAQLVLPTSIPRTGKPPVVFLNGYENDCGGASFGGNFGIADQVLQADGRATLFFNNCDLPNRPSIEALGARFGEFLNGLRYADGAAVDSVDVVAYSMGGLIVRSYLSGKQEATRSFRPPATVPVRKLIFIATPQFGTGLAFGFGLNRQVEEITSGSQFLFDLATWNQDTEDFRGIDSMAIIGNGGTGIATTAGFDDGVAATSSASISFVQPGKTRIIPNCHTDGGGLISAVGLCPANARGVAPIRAATDPQARMIRAFLNGTDEWKSVGTAAEDDRILSRNGGVIVGARTPADADSNVIRASADSATLTPSTQSRNVAYNDMVAAGTRTAEVTTAAGVAARAVDVAPAVYKAAVIKTGPRVVRVYPAAAPVYPLAVAAGSIISIYGDDLGGASATVNSAPVEVFYSSPSQINAVLPEGLTGLVKLSVQSAAGSHTINVLIERAVPAVFTQNAAGSGQASALNARDYRLADSSNPLRAGDYLVLYVTGLGSTETRGGLQWAVAAPTVTISGRDCALSFAGRAPGFKGLDQINCVVPAGLGRNGAAEVVVRSGVRSSNVATVAVE